MSSATSINRRPGRLAWMVLGLCAGLAILFWLVALWHYNFKPTFGTVILSLGFKALIVTGFLLVRAAMTFDFAHGGAVIGTLTDDRRLELEREKKTLLKAIKEIEFDQGMGKIDDQEAAVAIARYRARALEILRLLDEDTATAGAGVVEARVEKELARRLAKGGVAKAGGAKADAPAPAKLTPFCTKCGIKNDDDAAFCKKCGGKLEQRGV